MNLAATDFDFASVKDDFLQNNIHRFRLLLEETLIREICKQLGWATLPLDYEQQLAGRLGMMRTPDGQSFLLDGERIVWYDLAQWRIYSATKESNK